MTETKKIVWIWRIAAAVLLLAVSLTLILSGKPGNPPDETTVLTETTLPSPPENPLTAADFAFEGDYLTCLSAESILGVDVSTHQGQIDWQEVRSAGVEFVMIRLGYRGTTEGGLYEDEWAIRHYDGARAAGLKVGGYFFSQAITPEEAAREAEFVLATVADWQLDMPLVYDWEYVSDDSRTAATDARTVTDCAKAFCDAVEQAGYTSMVYFNPDQSRSGMLLEELTDYGFWLAMYSEEMTYEYRVDMWQYTDAGTVPGIKGPVDLNLYFPQYE